MDGRARASSGSCSLAAGWGSLALVASVLDWIDLVRGG